MKFNKLYRTVLLASLAISPLVLTQRPIHADQAPQSADKQAASTNSSTNSADSTNTSSTRTSSATSSTSTPSSSSTATSASHASSKQSSTSTVTSTPSSTKSSSSSSTPTPKPAPKPKPSNSQADWKKLPNRLSKAAVRRLVKACGIKYRKLSKAQLAALRKINLHSKRPRSGRRLTYKNMADIATALINGNKRYRIPYFKASKIENLNSAYTVDAQDAPNGPKSKLDIWDSWAVQNPKDGTVTNWNGYQLVIAMMGKADPGANSNHLYLMYNKYGDKNYQDWKVAGSVFGYNASSALQQWSGSTTVNSDHSLQLYYTKVLDTPEAHYKQSLASATINLKLDANGLPFLPENAISNDRVIFEGDGFHYQTFAQYLSAKASYPNNSNSDLSALRDPHLFTDTDNQRYLVFEGNTGEGDGNIEGINQLFDFNNYGGSKRYNLRTLLKILKNKDQIDRATWSNSTLGLIGLNNDEKVPTVNNIFNPLVTANMSTEEIERPNLVHMHGKYYLFTASRLWRSSNTDATNRANQKVGDSVMMLGYVSKHLTYGYRPLNHSGIVLAASVPSNWRTATYSYYALPVQGKSGSNKLLVTSYMSNRFQTAGPGMSASPAPTMLIQVNNNDTTKVYQLAANQNVWVASTKDFSRRLISATRAGAYFIRNSVSTYRFITVTSNRVTHCLLGKKLVKRTNGRRYLVKATYTTNDGATTYLSLYNAKTGKHVGYVNLINSRATSALGKAHRYGRKVVIKSNRYAIYRNLNASPKPLKIARGRYFAEYYYKHLNGRIYYSLYNLKTKAWIGYINKKATK